jgi:hypothetical protein
MCLPMEDAVADAGDDRYFADLEYLIILLQLLSNYRSHGT